MNTKSVWNDQIPERDGIKTPVNDIAISPGMVLHTNVSVPFYCLDFVSMLYS
jgi:hypothetical protein